MGHLMTDSRLALIVDARLTVAAGTAELEAALAMNADPAAAYNIIRIPKLLAATGRVRPQGRTSMLPEPTQPKKANPITTANQR